MYKCPGCQTELNPSTKPKLMQGTTEITIFNCNTCNCEIKIITNSIKKPTLLEGNNRGIVRLQG